MLPVAGEGNTALRERPGHPGADLYGRPAIGAQAHVVLPDGRKLVAQVDGGSGHASSRSREIQLGLGQLSLDTQLAVDIDWRDIQGQVQHTTLNLSPGWHTVLLGNPDSARIFANN